MAELNDFKANITPFVISEFEMSNGNIGEIAQELLYESIELTPSQIDYLNNWRENGGEEVEGSWVDFLIWLIGKIIEWIKEIFS